jgi:RND family efflux transporter MFP subunit
MKRFTLLAFTLVGAACSSDDPGRLPISDGPLTVTVSAEQRAPSVETYAATIHSERTAQIATRLSGTVIDVPVDVGSRVRAGQILVTLDAADVSARVASVRAQLDLAERSLERMVSLAGDGAASQQELDQARATAQAARAGMREAQAQEAYAVVRAPFDGVVTSRSADPGDLAVPGGALLTVIAPEALKVVAELPAQRSGGLAPGDIVGVRVTGREGTWPARISRVVPQLESGSRTFRVEAAPLEEWVDVVPGAYARIVIAEDGAGPRWLPSDAIVERGQLRGVYALDGDTLRLRWVRLGQHRDGAVQLLAGPTHELTVVRDPSVELHDGRTVTGTRHAAWVVPGASTSEEATR